MNLIISTQIYEKSLKFLLHDRFAHPYSLEVQDGNHHHNYSELHIMLIGNARYQIGGIEYTLHPNDTLLIPAQVKHFCSHSSNDAKICSFMIDTYTRNSIFTTLPEFAIQGLLEEIALAEQSKNYIRVVGYLSLISSFVYPDLKISPEHNSNYKLVIENYIESNYAKNPSLTELSEWLGLSTSHTSRLIKNFLGLSFDEAIASKRIEVAKFLIKKQNLSKTQAAEKVGYLTYSGFYKAFNKYGK